MKYRLSRRGAFFTAHGMVTPDRDGFVHVSQAQIEYLHEHFGITATPAGDESVPEPVDPVAQAAIAQQKAAADDHAQQSQRLPMPGKQKRHKR